MGHSTDGGTRVLVWAARSSRRHVDVEELSSMMQVLGDKLTVEQKEAVLIEYSYSTLGYLSVLLMVSCRSAA